jgi:hypothetical protein
MVIMTAVPSSDLAGACACVHRRESDVNQLRSEVHEVLGNRNMTDEKFQAVVLDEIAGLKVCAQH